MNRGNSDLTASKDGHVHAPTAWDAIETHGFHRPRERAEVVAMQWRVPPSHRPRLAQLVVGHKTASRT